MEFRIEEVGNLLLEGRVEDARKRFPEYTDEVFQYFVDGDVSGNQKYLMWMLSVVPESVRGLPLNEYTGHSRPKDWADAMLEDTKFFHDNQNSFEKRDINQYKSFSEFQETVFDVKGKVTEKLALKKAKKESIRLLDTPEHLIIIPKSYQASCTYGAGTRWCTTSKDSDNYYKQYTTSGTLIYVIRKNISEKDNLYKIAFHVQNVFGVDIYNAPDLVVKKESVVDAIGDEEWDIIRGPIIDYLDKINSQNLEFFLSEEEILSYLESGETDLLKLTDRRLLSLFGNVENIVDYAISKGLNPLEDLRHSTLVGYSRPPTIFRILDKHGVNKIDFISKSKSYNGILTLIRELQKFFDGSNNNIINRVLKEIEESEFQGLGNFITYIKSFLGVASTHTIIRLIFLEKNDKLIEYTNEHNLELIDYLNVIHISKSLGNKTGEYFTGGGSDERFLFFIENAGSQILNSVNTLLDLGFKKEDIFYMVEEGIITYDYITMDNLERLFDGKVKVGVRWFFDNVRMDLYINGVGEYYITLSDLAKLLGSDTIKFFTQELEKLGEGNIGGYDFDFTDDEDLNNFFNENMTTTELYEIFVEVNNDMDGFMKTTSMYNMEVNILHKIKIINETDLENDIIKGYENDVLNQISDVEKRDDGLHLISNEWCDFKGWMNSGSYRNSSTESLFEWYFCDEDNYEMFSDSYYDWHDDVWGMVESTNNVDYVKSYLEKHNIGESVFSGVGEEEYILTSEILQQMENQELGILITDNNFNDLQQELSNVYHWSYNHAYENEVSDMLREGINDIIGGDGEAKWETVKRKRYVSGEYKEYDSQIITHKLTNFWDNLHLYSEMLLNDGFEELEHSDFSEIITELMELGEMDQIDISVPDYPDHTEIRNQFKNLIHDYI